MQSLNPNAKATNLSPLRVDPKTFGQPTGIVVVGQISPLTQEPPRAGLMHIRPAKGVTRKDARISGILLPWGLIPSRGS